MAAHSIRPCLAILFTIFIAFSPSSSSSQASDNNNNNNNLPASTISAAPAILPDFISPLSSAPVLSPDIAPLFPSPGGDGLSPSMPLIPSSPSPPNPDEMEAPGPGMAFGPSGLMPDSFSGRLSVPVLLSSMVVVVFGGILVNADL